VWTSRIIQAIKLGDEVDSSASIYRVIASE